jgi:hypothetical protein
MRAGPLVLADEDERFLGSLFGGSLIAHVPGTRIELKRSGGRRTPHKRPRYRLYGTGADRAPTITADSEAEAVTKANGLLASLPQSRAS